MTDIILKKHCFSVIIGEIIPFGFTNIFHGIDLKNLSEPALKEAYSNYMTPNFLSEDLVEATSQTSGREDIKVVMSLIMYE